jgi:hypothetical protein
MVGVTPKHLVAVGAALLAAWVLAACGGSGDSTASQTAASKVAVETGPLKVVGGGSSSYRIPGHHVDVPDWGKEAGAAELRAAADVEHDYLIALVEKDWAKACLHVSEIVVQQLSAHPKTAGEGCPALLAAYAKPPRAGSDYEASEVEAQSLRAEGAWAYLLYRAATAPYYMPMVQEGDGWKVNSVAPVAFYD